MDLYRRMWTCLVMMAGAVGLWRAVLLWSIHGAVFFFLFTAVAIACVKLLMTKDDEQPQWRPALWTGLVGGAVLVPAGGIVALLGLPGLAAVALLTLGSPFVLNKIRQGRHANRRSVWPDSPPSRAPAGDIEIPGGGVGVAPLPTDDLPFVHEAPWMRQPAGSMDDATLFFAWRTSYVALQLRVPTDSRLRIVEKRQEFLDELERRDAHGFSAWLTSGARAAGDPSKYVRSQTRHPHRHDQR